MPENCDENKENIPMNKRLLSLLLTLVLVLSLTACGDSKEEKKEPEEPQVEEPAEQPEGDETEIVDISEAQPEETEPAQPENLPADPAEKPEVNAKPADPAQKPESKPVEKPAQKPAAPAEKPAEKPAESKPAPSVDLAAFYETVASGDNMPAMMQAEGEVLDSFYPGLTGIQTNQCGVYTAMISAAVGEIALVEVQNSADVQAVKDIFQARINYQVGDDQNPGGAWYPASIEGWKNGSRIVSNGNYVMLIALSEGADDVVSSFNALFA